MHRGGLRSVGAAIVLVGVLGVTMASCGDAADPGRDDPLVVATTSILGDIVANLPLRRIEVLIPSGVDPHAYQPSSQEVALLRSADLVIANGLGLEASLDAILTAARADGVRIIEVAAAADPLDLPGDGVDPHFWWDPVRVGNALTVMVSALAEVLPDEAEAIEAAADDYRARLLALDAEIEGMVAGLPPERRVLVTDHDTLGYFADRYGFEVVGTVLPGGSGLGEASSADLAQLAETIVARGVPAVFVDRDQQGGVAAAVAGAVGDVAIVPLDVEALGAPGSGTDTYLGLLETTAGAIVSALAE